MAMDDEWVKAAITDDAMVVELLVRLNRAPLPKPMLPLEWSGRQRRSKYVSVSNKAAHSRRASPTTPLSWSGGCDSEEYSRPMPFKLSTAARSKVNICGGKTISKRSRKKKTLAQLKAEESSLLKERRELEMEMTTLRMNLERQRATNEKLKRMKIEFHPATCHHITSLTPDLTLHPSMINVSDNENADAASDHKLSIPDLNIPFDEPNTDVTCETIKDAPVHLFSTEAQHVLRVPPTLINKG